MKRDYLISVIVAIYNIEDYIRKCIDSIIGQEYKNLQIILVDDGSADDSGNICEEYNLLDNRIEVIHKKNGGLVSARKAGLERAKGQYIGFVDGDDYIDRDFYLRLLEDIVSSEASFVHSGYIKERGAAGDIINQYEPGLYDIRNKQAEFVKRYILSVNSDWYIGYGLWSKLFKADLIKCCYSQIPDHQSQGEDKLCICICILHSDKVFLDTISSYHYVMRDESISHQTNIEKVIDYGQQYAWLLELFNKYGVIDEVRETLREHFADLYVNFLAYSLNHDNIQIFQFKDLNVLKGKKIIIYCAGRVGQDYYAQICKFPEIEIVAWADKNYNNYYFPYRQLVGKEQIMEFNFDYLIIAISDKKTADFIKQELIDVGVRKEKILWERPEKIL